MAANPSTRGAALAAVCALSFMSTTSVQAASSPPAFITAAVADKSRPEADTQRDADRKPAESVAFADVKPGSQVVELIPGGGYFTRILSKAVGPKGVVYAFSPAPRADAPPGGPDRAAAVKAIAADPAYANVKVLVQPLKGMQLPDKVDLVWTSQNYHDMHNAPDFDMLTFNKAIFDALKPGGVYLVIDHAAAADAPADVTSTLHRINPDVVKREVEAAGFKLEAQSDVLKNPDDPHTAGVRDAGVRGKTDQFVFRFRKPKK
jgi:predicted methyltransferase